MLHFLEFSKNKVIQHVLMFLTSSIQHNYFEILHVQCSFIFSPFLLLKTGLWTLPNIYLFTHWRTFGLFLDFSFYKWHCYEYLFVDKQAHFVDKSLHKLPIFLNRQLGVEWLDHKINICLIRNKQTLSWKEFIILYPHN